MDGVCSGKSRALKTLLLSDHASFGPQLIAALNIAYASV